MRYQFKLSALIVALFYGAGLSAFTVRFAGSDWLPAQTVAAYVAVMSLTLGLFFALRGKLLPVGYLLLAPLLFVFALVAAALFSPPQFIRPPAGTIVTGPVRATTATATNPPPLSPSPLMGGNR